MGPRRSCSRAVVLGATLLACASGYARDGGADACPAAPPSLSPEAEGHAIRTVFVIVLENQDWSSIVGSASAPFINSVLLPQSAHAENYRNGGVHPSLGNYVALEAGSPLGIDFDLPPSEVALPPGCHLASDLEQVGLSWKAYQEGIDGTACPITDAFPYAVRHDPFVYFQDVAGSPPSPTSQRCLQHVRPFSELARDLEAATVPRYSFITPDLCHSGHDACAPAADRIRQSDDWLAQVIPMITASRAFQDGGAILITWDEGAAGDRPIGMIAVSPVAKRGYAGPLPYSHASTVRTIQEIFGVTPLLRDASSATSLSDLFSTYP